MKTRSAIVLLFLSALILVGSQPLPALSAEGDQKGETVVLRVNGEIITEAALEREVGRHEGQMTVPAQPADAGKNEAIRKKALDGIVDRTLLVQEGKKLGIEAKDAQVDEEIKAFKARFPSPDQFDAMLARMKMTEPDVRTEFYRRMTIRAVIEREVTPKVKVSEEEIKGFYDQNPSLFKTPERVRASHILLKTDPKATDQDKAAAREKILSIKKRIEGGEDFATLAKSSSECPSAAKGGDLDYFEKGQMVPAFEEAAFALKPGELSNVVETQFGFHLIKVVDRKDPGAMSFEETKPTIEEHLKQQKVTDQLTVYLAELKSRATIEAPSK